MKIWPRIIRLIIRLSLPYLLLASSNPSYAEKALADLQVSICDDQSEWPPYTYFERKNGQPSSKVIGYTLDVLEDIFKRHHIQYKLEMIPWARCQAELKVGKQYQMALNLSYSEERDKNYLLTHAVYQTTNYYFYSRRQFPQGLQIKNVADLKNYQACGLLGFNYSGYGYKADEMDQGAKTFTALIGKLHNRRCALFVEKIEVMTGFLAVGQAYLRDKDLAFAPIPGMQAAPFHMAISPHFAQANALQALLNDEIDKMQASGRLKELWQAYANLQ